MTGGVGAGGGKEGERGREKAVGGGGSGDVLAKVTAGNAVYVRRSKVACRVAELSSLALAPFAFLPSRMPPPPPPAPAVSVRSFVRSSVRPLSLFFSRSLGAPRHGADCRNAPNAPR